MSLFEFENYRIFLRSWIKKQDRKGRGQVTRLAEASGAHTTLVSQILAGDKDFSVDQAYLLAGFLSLTTLETEYWILLVQKERAGDLTYKKYIEKKLEDIKKKSREVSNRITSDHELTEEQKSKFYSSWRFSALRLFCSVDDKGQSVEDLHTRFRISKSQIISDLEFLCECQLLEKSGDHYKMKSNKTVVSKTSAHFSKHHMNWRTLSSEKSQSSEGENDLLVTAPMSISKNDFEKTRQVLLNSIQQITQIAVDSKAEDICCLNIDLFWVKS